MKNYNYQNFINGYNDPFMSGFRRANNKYMDKVNEESLITLFNFDRDISKLILSNIFNIE
ncbi:Abi family protein, partial [Mycoplasmoides pirum]|uniref:Abi family protein n=1 Tax=Mycoplasmoides pirum TaxID=2122 RepID=UPI003A7F4BCF